MNSGKREGNIGSEGRVLKGKKEKERSLGNIEELWKRKRDLLERSGEYKKKIFKRSKVIDRSPKRGREGNENREIGRMIREMRKEVRDMMEKLSKEIKK